MGYQAYGEVALVLLMEALFSSCLINNRQRVFVHSSKRCCKPSRLKAYPSMAHCCATTFAALPAKNLSTTTNMASCTEAPDSAIYAGSESSKGRIAT